jgi:hypothetical protein
MGLVRNDLLFSCLVYVDLELGLLVMNEARHGAKGLDGLSFILFFFSFLIYFAFLLVAMKRMGFDGMIWFGHWTTSLSFGIIHTVHSFGEASDGKDCNIICAD